MLDIGFVRRAFPGRELHYYETIDTTMRAAAELQVSGSAVIAEEQTAGQGRHGHAWHSEKGLGLYLSVYLLPELRWESAPTLTMALGLATADAIALATGLICDLRWPNDLMVGTKKVAGILTQLADSAAVAGIGVNVKHEHFPEELAAEATSLRMELGRPQSREQILIELLPAIDRYVAMLEERGAGAILDLFSRRSSYASGKRVVVKQG